MEGEALADPTPSVGTLKPGLPHPVISLVPMARGLQRMETVIPHSGNPGDSKVVPSHTDFPHHQQVAPGSLLHRGLPDTWARGETLHQAQDTFLRDVVVTQTRRKMRFGMGPWGSAPPWSPASPLCLLPSSSHLREESSQYPSVHSPGGDTEVLREARGALAPHGQDRLQTPSPCKLCDSALMGLGWQPQTEHKAQLPSSGHPSSGKLSPGLLGRLVRVRMSS